MALIDTKIVKLMASKLGVDSNNVIRKTSELLRLLQLRTSGVGGIPFNDVCRTVLCVDLACSSVGVPFDKAEAIRLSGVTKKVYSNGLHTIEKLLELSAPPSVSSLSVQLGVSEVSAFASKLLEKYIEVQSEGPPDKRKVVDTSFPMYHAAAISVTCKSQKVKVDQAKILEMSRIKRADFKKLVDEFNTVVDKVTKMPMKQASKRTNKLMDLVDQSVNDSKLGKRAKNVATKENFEDEDFESWKKRLLGDDA